MSAAIGKLTVVCNSIGAETRKNEVCLTVETRDAGKVCSIYVKPEEFALALTAHSPQTCIVRLFDDKDN